MASAEIKELRQTARKLLALDNRIRNAAAEGDRNFMQVAQGGSLSPTAIIIPAVVAAVALLLMLFKVGGDVAAIILTFVVLIALGHVYSGWVFYSGQKSAARQGVKLTNEGNKLARQREHLLRELAEKKAAAGFGEERRFWWDSGLDPSKRPKIRGEYRTPAWEDWDFDVFFEVRLEARDDGVYLHDFRKEPVYYSAEQVEALRTGKMVELYRDSAIYGKGVECYACLHLYANDITPLEEITSSTTSHRVDKEAAMEALRESFDNQERLYNGSFQTNFDRYVAGEMSSGAYMSASLYRDNLENEYEKSLPDVVHHTQYRKGFHNLLSLEFVSCAMIFVAASGENIGKTALILMPTVEQKSIFMTMRSESPDVFCGYLERYIGFDSLAVGGCAMQPSVSTAAPIFNQKNRQWLGLKPRNILEKKPRGLTEAEWQYMVWNDSDVR